MNVAAGCGEDGSGTDSDYRIGAVVASVVPLGRQNANAVAAEVSDSSWLPPDRCYCCYYYDYY